MQAELTHFLDQHPIVHPTRLVGVEMSPKKIRLGFEGYPWWKTSDPTSGNDRIYFEFREVSSGQLDVSVLADLNEAEADEVLEDFSIIPNTPGDWTDDARISIICQSALPDPMGLYARLHSYLQRERARLGSRDFLNCPPGKLKHFAELTSSTLYVVAQVPEKIAAFIESDLDSQNVPHYRLEREAVFSPRLIVHWCGSTFMCETAFAEFD